MCNSQATRSAADVVELVFDVTGVEPISYQLVLALRGSELYTTGRKSSPSQSFLQFNLDTHATSVAAVIARGIEPAALVVDDVGVLFSCDLDGFTDHSFSKSYAFSGCRDVAIYPGGHLAVLTASSIYKYTLGPTTIPAELPGFPQPGMLGSLTADDAGNVLYSGQASEEVGCRNVHRDHPGWHRKLLRLLLTTV